MSEFYMAGIGEETPQQKKKRKAREKKARQKAKKAAEKKKNEEVGTISEAALPDNKYNDQHKDITNEQHVQSDTEMIKKKKKKKKKQKKKDSTDDLDEMALLDLAIKEAAEAKKKQPTLQSTSKFDKREAEKKAAKRKALRERMSLERKSRGGKLRNQQRAQEAIMENTGSGSEGLEAMMQGMGNLGGLEAMMKNMDPNVMEMAQNMMNNPAMMARAERMMKDPDAMANAIKKLNASGSDPKAMAKTMMDKMNAETNSGVVQNSGGAFNNTRMNAANNGKGISKTINKPYDENKNRDLLDDLSDELDMLELEEYGNRNKKAKDKSYATLGKRITNLMLEFDKVDVSGSDELREERKEYIQRIQKLGDLVAES